MDDQVICRNYRAPSDQPVLQPLVIPPFLDWLRRNVNDRKAVLVRFAANVGRC